MLFEGKEDLVASAEVPHVRNEGFVLTKTWIRAATRHGVNAAIFNGFQCVQRGVCECQQSHDHHNKHTHVEWGKKQTQRTHKHTHTHLPAFANPGDVGLEAQASTTCWLAAPLLSLFAQGGGSGVFVLVLG